MIDIMVEVLPYFVGEVIPDRGSLFLQTPESLASRFRLDVRTRHEGTSVNRDRHAVPTYTLRTDDDMDHITNTLRRLDTPATVADVSGPVVELSDGTEKSDASDGRGTLVTMAGLADRQGRAAADSIAGIPTSATPAPGTVIVGRFDPTIAMVGRSKKRLVSTGREHRIIHTHPRTAGEREMTAVSANRGFTVSSVRGGTSTKQRTGGRVVAMNGRKGTVQ